MKTAISLPDDLFADAERLARRLHKSRSQLYREAIAAYVARFDDDAVTRAIDAVVDEVGGGADDFTRAAAARTLRRTEW